MWWANWCRNVQNSLALCEEHTITFQSFIQRLYKKYDYFKFINLKGRNAIIIRRISSY
jgi:hypothetical protein